MGRSEAGLGCNKHPKRRQWTGICPFCLTERLSQLAGSYNSATVAPSGSSSPHSDAVSFSSNLSPIRQPRLDSEIRGSTSMSFLSRGKNRLVKSRSLVCIPHNRGGERKSGFWSKLLRLGSLRNGVRTLKETSMVS